MARVEEMLLFAGPAIEIARAAVAALSGIADELAELRRSVDHHAVVTSRPELHSRAAGFYADNHGLLHQAHH